MYNILSYNTKFIQHITSTMNMNRFSKPLAEKFTKDGLKNI